jgi:ABC-type Fe3+ transport system permease subunit
LTRIASFLTWQLGALVVAVISAFYTQRAAARGIEGLRLPGYAPFAMSLFVLVSFIGIVGYRVWLQPLLAAWFGLV